MTFIGHATVRLDYEGVRVLTDPVLRERLAFLRRVVPPVPPVAYAEVDVVVLSHLHHDHCDLPSLARLAPEPQIVVPAGGGEFYRFVVLSDHGQSQGATFKQRYGQRLEDVVRDLMTTTNDTDGPMVATGDDEQWGRVGTLLTEVGDERKVTGRLSRRALRRHQRHEATSPADRPEVIVVAGGNLGMVYFPRQPGRLTVEEIETLYPQLLTGLVEHPGIGIAMARSKSDGPVAFGTAGTHHLDGGRVTGGDPVAPYGPHAAADLRRHDALPHVGDIVLISRLDPGTDEVAAFEELVGCHGGLGGWQTRTVLIHPADWPVHQQLTGADAVHRQLVQWLELAGLRGQS